MATHRAQIKTATCGPLNLDLGINVQALNQAYAWAHDAYHDCDVCPLTCHVNRHAGQTGRCGLDADARVYKEYLHLGEERWLLPSHTIYLSGCNFRCVFCSDAQPVKRPQQFGQIISPEALAKRIAHRRRQGATNVNFVGGLPDVNILYVLDTLRHCPADTHVVWNTNLWTTPRAIEALNGVVGTWLVDWKFANNACAKTLAGVTGYEDRITALLPKLRGNIIVRHLVMPGHLDCCTQPFLNHMVRLAPELPVNLMTGYHPFGLSGQARPLGRRLNATELDRVHAMYAEQALSWKLLDGALIDYP